MSRKESNDYFEDVMRTLERQIKEIDEPTKYSSAESSYDSHEDSSTFNQIRKERKSKVAKITKKSQLEELKKKYPHSGSKWAYGDRDQIQYSKLVSTKELNVAEFVLKWEYDHQHRIHKNIAWELLTERKGNGIISDEFLKSIKLKFEK